MTNGLFLDIFYMSEWKNVKIPDLQEEKRITIKKGSYFLVS
jgi:hypothetical protein